MTKTILLKQGRVAMACALLFMLTAATYSNVHAASPGKLIGATEVVIPDWFKTSFLDFRDDAEEAAEEDRHLLIYFHIDGCPYCQKMLDDNFRGEENKAIVQASFDSVELNMHGSREVVFDEDKTLIESDLVKALEVRYTPTMLFMNASNQIVMRLNGYRSPREFRQVLNFVKDKAYLKMDFPSYRDAILAQNIYVLQDHPIYNTSKNIEKLIATGNPVAILFEDSSCDACETFHKEVFGLKAIQSALENYTVVRLDALSNGEIVDNNGNKTTAKAWLKSLNISYRPSVMLFNEHKKRETVTGLLKSFHFQQLLSYVSGKHYDQYHSWSQYMTGNLEKLLKSGKTVDVWQ